MKRLEFVGTALDDLREFPLSARRECGYQLDRVQRGLEPTDWRPMRSVGLGVCEIRVREDSGAYRVIYLAKLADRTQKTADSDLALATRRYAQAGGASRKGER
ncbi:type II toxin-antitoxin system RelE/ParE family toxin [Nocardia rhizosphaerihabitans]|uniref:type II toxin-antitoxin system RelE/ParE family toxin n=1 Tax=Nocardia rhizosphaerihabitans TaxID=1691570 RepID=UPI003673395C